MHDGIYLGYIGLTELEVKVLKSIFTLAPELKENFSLVPPDQIRKADLVLVNGDDPRSMRLWEKLHEGNQLLTSLILTDSEMLAGGETLQRPIRVQKLIDALEDVVDRTSVEFSDEVDRAPALDILVVDDSYPVRKYMEHKLAELAKFPITISFAMNGDDAVRKTAAHDFGLVFLDVMMEGMDGYKACKHIKASQDAYVVMLTSKKSPFDKVRGTMSGCDAYVTKPPADARLIDELNKAIERRNDRVLGIGRARVS